MRSLLTISMFAAALSLSFVSGARAQQKGDYCLRGDSTAEMNCSFATLAQCQAAMSGSINESCIRNPKSTNGLPAPSPR